MLTGAVSAVSRKPREPISGGWLSIVGMTSTGKSASSALKTPHTAILVRSAATLSARATARFARLFHAMLERGVYLPPSAYEACFLSLAHSSDDLARFTHALRESLAQLE